MVCTSVQACLKFSHSLSRTIVPRGIGAAAARRRRRRRRRRQPADGLNNRRRENEVEGKKKGGKARGNPASRLLRDTSRYRRVVVDRSFDDSMVGSERFNSCPADYVRGRVAWGSPSVQVCSDGRIGGIDVFSIPRQSDIIRV